MEDNQTPGSDEVIAKLQQELGEMRGQLTKLKEEVKVLKGATEGNEPDEPKIPTQSFEVDDVEYVFTAPSFNVRGLKRTALEALTDDEKHKQLGGKTIREYLVANDSTLVKIKED